MKAVLTPLRLLGLFLWVGFNAAAAEGESRPNILWLVSEDNDPLLGCFGDSLARTPNIDRLAKEGIVFDRCFAQPVCAPSRFALISGMFAVSNGPAEHMRAKGKIPTWLKGFPEYLKDKGYYVTNNAKTDYNSPIDPSVTWNESGRSAHYSKRSDPKQPFFSVFNHEVCHESCLFPLKSPAMDFTPTDPAAVRIPPYQPDTLEMRADWARYYDCIALMDQQIGVKLRDLEKAGLAEDTIVFYYSDNGGTLPRSKRFLQKSGTNVPLIVYFPPKWRHLAPAAPGTRISDPVSFVDFAPTVLSLTGVKKPSYMQGRAFLGAAKEKAPEFVFCTRDRMDERYDTVRSVMDKRWLYIHNFRPDVPYVLPLSYMFQARGYQSWARQAAEGKLTQSTAMFWGQKPNEELYDMEEDPDNVKNLAGDPKHQGRLTAMRSALRRHTVELVDNGFMPEGAVAEGYDASRAIGAFPIDRAFDMASLASERLPENLQRLVKGLEDPSEAVRWWAAQGCVMLGKEAAGAEKALLARALDESGGVQVAVGEALVRLGNAKEGLLILERCLQQETNFYFSLQAANALDRLGEGARPSLEVVKSALQRALSKRDKNRTEKYGSDILERIVGVLEGRIEAFVYPKAAELN